MRIADISATVHRFETRLPLVDRPAGARMRVVCRVTADDGRVGFGMASKFMPHGVAACINHHLAAALKGMEVRRLEAIHDRLRPVISERGHMSGINLSAASAVDLALWDLLGQQAGCSVAALLGGHKERADIYVTFGFTSYDRDQLVEVARQLLAQGQTRLKMLVEDCDIAWFEDPVATNDPRDLAALRRQTTIPLSAGQMDGHTARFRTLLEHDAIDILMPNSLFNGGMSETRRVAHLAQIYNRPLSDAGGGGIYSVHHVAGFRNGTLAEHHLVLDQIDRRVFTDAPEPDGASVQVPEAPGFGVTPDEDALRETLETAR